MPAPTEDQLSAILDQPGHAPCPGVDMLEQAGFDPLPPAVVYRPKKPPSAPLPAVLAFHGGGFGVGAPPAFGELGKYLALTLGLTTVSAPYRLATQGHPTFPGLLDDASFAWRWLQSRASDLHIDPARIALAGESAGVFVAAHLAVASPFVTFDAASARPAALLAQWGPIDFVARWFDRGESPGAESALLGTDYAKNPALYHRSSPLTYAVGSLPPALFLHGEQDRVVHPRQARLGLAAWHAAGADAELRLFDNVGHGVVGDNRAQRLAVLEACADFLARRLHAAK